MWTSRQVFSEGSEFGLLIVSPPFANWEQKLDPPVLPTDEEKDFPRNVYTLVLRQICDNGEVGAHDVDTLAA